MSDGDQSFFLVYVQDWPGIFCGNNYVTENPVLAKETLLHFSYSLGQ